MKRLLICLALVFGLVGCADRFEPTEIKQKLYEGDEKVSEQDFTHVQMVELEEICSTCTFYRNGVEMDIYFQGWVKKEDWLQSR